MPLRLLIKAFAVALALAAGAAAATDYPPNQIPMYGGVEKTPAMLQADKTFIAAILAKGVTLAQGSDQMVHLGWDYFRKSDQATAMERFNQAWLLDPDNGDAFHGFAAVVVARDKDVAAADALFQQGLAKPRQSPGIYVDYGRFLLLLKRPADAIAPLRRAVSFPDIGPDAKALLTVALFQSGDRTGACAEAVKVKDTAQAGVLDDVRLIVSTCPKG
jgi:Tfp pilus assembly protein PilF